MSKKLTSYSSLNSYKTEDKRIAMVSYYCAKTGLEPKKNILVLFLFL